MPKTILLCFLLTLGFLTLSGCGNDRPSRVPVSGQVLIDGKPLTSGTVMVIPENDRAAYAEINQEGKFSLTTYDKNDGCVIGKHRVSVAGIRPVDNFSVEWLAPQKYEDHNESGLKVNVTGPRDDVKLELTWDGGKPYIQHFGKE